MALTPGLGDLLVNEGGRAVKTIPAAIGVRFTTLWFTLTSECKPSIFDAKLTRTGWTVLRSQKRVAVRSPRANRNARR